MFHMYVENDLYLPVYKLHFLFQIFSSQHKLNLYEVRVAH